MRKNREIKTYDLDPTTKDENRINDVEGENQNLANDEDIEQNPYLEKVYLSQVKSKNEDSEICKKLIKKK